MNLGQIGEELRQLHERLVVFVGNDGVAKAIEGGVALLFVLLFLFYLKGHVSPASRRRRAARRRFQQLVRAHRLPKADRQALLAMARQIDLDEPALIFVQRSLFESAAEQGGFSATRLDTLRREIYS